MEFPQMNRRHFLLTFPLWWARWAAPAEKSAMIIRSARPENWEMPLDGFRFWLTPIERFFVRSHHYRPEIDLNSWRLSIAGEVEQPLQWTLQELRRMPKVEITAVLECAGNGRGLYEPSMPGVQWTYGAVGNARWGGVRVADLLRRARLKPGAAHVVFDGADRPVGSMPKFQRSVPLKKLLDPSSILAYEMNGEPLPASHGAPLRLVLPGWAGDSWCKWLTSLTVARQELDGFYMKTAYRHPGRAVLPGSAVDPAAMHPVETVRIKSVMYSPAPNSELPPEPLTIRGVAWSGVSPVHRVEVSLDHGRSWLPARLDPQRGRFAWRSWSFRWARPSPGYYLLMARAFALDGTTQPLEQEWNPSGYLNNTVQRLPVLIHAGAPKANPQPAGGEAGQLPGFQPPPAFQRACLSCHDEDIIMQQRLTRSQWEREVDKMIRWGAPRLEEPDRRAVLDYLYRLYGPRPRE